MTTQVDALRAQLEDAIDDLERAVVALNDRAIGATKKHVQQAQGTLSVLTFAETTQELLNAPAGVADATVQYAGGGR